MVDSFKPLSRQQLAKFLPDDEAIRFFERLFRQAGQATPDELSALQSQIYDTDSEAKGALSVAVEALKRLDRIASALEFLSSVPSVEKQEAALPDIQRVFNKCAEQFPALPNIAKSHCYGVFYDMTTQTAAAINTAYPVMFDTAQIERGVHVGSPTSRIYVHAQGVYNFQFSAQLDNTSGGVAVVYIWARVNGVDVADSAGKVRIKDNNSESIAAWNYVLELGAGDYFELVWEVDDTSLILSYESAVSPHPAVPSVILTVTDNIS